VDSPIKENNRETILGVGRRPVGDSEKVRVEDWEQERSREL